MKNIMVMDDEEIILKATSKMLKYLGYKAETVSNSSEAINKFKNSVDQNSPFDAIIMDYTIPGDIGAAQTFTELKKIVPDVVGILSSGYNNEEIRNDYKNYNFQGLIFKPYGIKELEDILKDLLN